MPFIVKGCRVEITGLTGRVELNGKLGTVAEFRAGLPSADLIEGTGRWIVRCDGSGRSILVKTVNLNVISGPCASDVQPEPPARPALMTIYMSKLRDDVYFSELLLKAKAIAKDGTAIQFAVHADHLGDKYSGLPICPPAFSTFAEVKNGLEKMREMMSPRVQRNQALQRDIYERGGDLPEDIARLHQNADAAWEMYNNRK